MSTYPPTVVVKEKSSPFWWILGATLLVLLIVAYMNRERLQDAVGMSAVRTRPQPAAKKIQEQRRRKGAQVSPAPAAVAPVAVETPAVVQAACTDGSIPKPFNVYQDNLSGSNDITVGPGVAFDGVGGVPVDYAGQCSGVNPAAVWQSTQLLPGANCGQSLEGTSDWATYAPTDPSVVNFLSAGMLAGQDTISTTLKNPSLDLRPEPQVTNCFTSPWNQSTYVSDSAMKADWSHSLVA